jgi:ATP-dependent RNA helicase RhlE
VATPGRLLDHANQRTIDLSRVEILVLDEADRMLDMGFLPDIRRIMALLPDKAERQNLLFSATFSEEIRQLAGRLLNAPQLLEVAPRNATVELIEQLVHPVDQNRKRELLSHMIGAGNWRQVLVFTRTKHGANRLAKQLEQDGTERDPDPRQQEPGGAHARAGRFQAWRGAVLVATDIAARGLDIDQLPHVVNYEMPNVPEDYVHRIGRTGRAGSTGQALSLVSDDERDRLRAIERVLGRKINVLPLDRSGIATPAPEMGVVRREGEHRQGQRHQGQRAQTPRSQPAPAHIHRPHGGGGGVARPAGTGAPRRRSAFRQG